LPNDASIALGAHGLWKRYGRRSPWALADVDLSVCPGLMTALVGPNGAGKSTLIRTWLGFEQPSEGAVDVAGVDPTKDRPAAVAHIGYVPQQSQPWRGLTVEDHLTRASMLRRGFDRDGARERLLSLDIDLRRRATTLSGGERAQLVLTLALGTGADVLLLDEPLASLDPFARREFLRILRTAVQTERRTALLSSHIVGDLAVVCDQIVVLVDGRVVLDGAVADILASHRITTEEPSDGQAVGRFLDVTGVPKFISRQAPAAPEERSSLEEIVIGYLAGRGSASARE
jgi:ABC-2 type transport system ATP-binding protein